MCCLYTATMTRPLIILRLFNWLFYSSFPFKHTHTWTHTYIHTWSHTAQLQFLKDILFYHASMCYLPGCLIYLEGLNFVLGKLPPFVLPGNSVYTLVITLIILFISTEILICLLNWTESFFVVAKTLTFLAASWSKTVFELCEVFNELLHGEWMINQLINKEWLNKITSWVPTNIWSIKWIKVG